MTRRTFDFLVCVAALIFYLVNRLFLAVTIDGPVGWFLTCYANDIFAGAAIIAWLDLLLSLGHLGKICSWKQVAPFLLFCGLIWEVGAPLFKPNAVFDPWDFAAYQAGGLLWLSMIHLCPLVTNRKTPL